MELTQINGKEIAYIRGTGRPNGIGLLMKDMEFVKHDEKCTVVTFTYDGHRVYLRESGRDYLLMCKAEAQNAYTVIGALERKLRNASVQRSA